jgi:MoaA/NifB/PqqE/SkfB family radical SAM enzyme
MGKYLIPPQSEFDAWNRILAKQGDKIISSIDSTIAMFYPITFDATVDLITNYSKGGKVYPLKLEIFPTHICNHACCMCIVEHYRSNSNLERNIMPFEIIHNILQDAEDIGVQLITLSGGGEPSIYTQFDDILDYFSNSKMNLMLFTNGSNLSEVNCTQLISLDAIVNISLNAGNREQYRIVSGVDSFEKVVHVMEHLKWARNNNDFRGMVCASYVVIPENVTGIIEAVNLASNMELNHINFKPASEIELSFSENDKKTLVEQLAYIQRRKWNTKIVFSKNTKIFYESIKRPMPVSSRCFQGLFSLNIDATSSIYPCPVQTSKAEKAISTLYKTSLKKFVASGKYQKWPSINNDKAIHKGCFNDQFNIVINWMYNLLSKYPDIVFVRSKE